MNLRVPQKPARVSPQFQAVAVNAMKSPGHDMHRSTQGFAARRPETVARTADSHLHDGRLGPQELHRPLCWKPRISSVSEAFGEDRHTEGGAAPQSSGPPGPRGTPRQVAVGTRVQQCS